jgi:N-acetylglucosaminyldiphosphoundecaprenol N-acetyl-beta-D-mannosaminyltransferase
MGVGGSFDVLSGMISRAPLWIQKSGLEWLYRLSKEPRRLFKRYTLDNLRFLFLLLKEWWRPA